MKSLILNKKNIPFAIILILLIYVFTIGRNKNEVTEVVIPAQSNEAVIDNPIPEIRIDTFYTEAKGKKIIEKIVPVENPINKELLQKYEQAIQDNDSLKALTLYKEAVTERLYIETLEDSVQTITVKTEVTGTMKKQSIDYLTKAKTVQFQTNKAKPSFFAGAFTCIPTKQAEVPVVGLNLYMMNKTGKRLLSVGCDNEKRVHLGIAIKLF